MKKVSILCKIHYNLRFYILCIFSVIIPYATYVYFSIANIWERTVVTASIKLHKHVTCPSAPPTFSLFFIFSFSSFCHISICITFPSLRLEFIPVHYSTHSVIFFNKSLLPLITIISVRERG